MAINFGSNPITNIYKGSTQINKVYKGSTLVWSGSLLPDGYTQLEYIRSTGTQYIITNYYPNTNTKVYVDLISYQKSSDPFECVFGARDADALNRCFALFGGGNTNVQAYIGNTGYMQYILEEAFLPGTRFEIELEKGKLTVDEVVTTGEYTEINCATPLTVFGRNTAGVVSNLAKISVFKFTISENNSVVRDFIPCLNPDGVVGMFDTVTQTFFGNSGTGAFLTPSEASVATLDLTDEDYGLYDESDIMTPDLDEEITEGE